jgi:hypothetical protein
VRELISSVLLTNDRETDPAIGGTRMAGLLRLRIDLGAKRKTAGLGSLIRAWAYLVSGRSQLMGKRAEIRVIGVVGRCSQMVEDGRSLIRRGKALEISLCECEKRAAGRAVRVVCD